MKWPVWPEATFWRCRNCGGVVSSERLRIACSCCGGRHLIPVDRLTWKDRVRMMFRGYCPVTRHVRDPHL